jgi:hypothetical protein
LVKIKKFLTGPKFGFGGRGNRLSIFPSGENFDIFPRFMVRRGGDGGSFFCGDGIERAVSAVY